MSETVAEFLQWLNVPCDVCHEVMCDGFHEENALTDKGLLE